MGNKYGYPKSDAGDEFNKGYSPVLTRNSDNFNIQFTLGARDWVVLRLDNYGGSPTPTPTSTPTPTPAPGGDTYLSDLTWAYATCGWQTVQKDKSIEGNTITLNGVPYSKGLGTHAASDIRYNLGGRYSRFKSDVGVDDEKTTTSTIVFQVWADEPKSMIAV